MLPHEINISESWVLRGFTLSPTLDGYRKFCAHCRHDCCQDDFLVKFQLTTTGMRDSHFFIHRSRLLFAGGPLASLVSEGWAESRDRFVRLSDEDTPVTFEAIHKFLYCDTVELSLLKLPQLVDLALSAHRWCLEDLFNAVLVYIKEWGRLESVESLIDCKDLIYLPVGNSLFLSSFRDHYCAHVAEELELIVRLSSVVPAEPKDMIDKGNRHAQLDGRSLTAPTESLSSKEPGKPRGRSSAGANSGQRLQHAEVLATIWDVLLSNDLVHKLFDHLFLDTIHKEHNMFLLDMVLRFYEPRTVVDEDVVKLILRLDAGNLDMYKVFAEGGLAEGWSPRGLLLAGRAFSRLTSGGSQVKFTWNLALGQFMLEAETWEKETLTYAVGATQFSLIVRHDNNKRRGLGLYLNVAGDHGDVREAVPYMTVLFGVQKSILYCSCEEDEELIELTKSIEEKLLWKKELSYFDSRPTWGWPAFVSPKDFKQWIAKHDATCELSVTATIRFFDD